MDVCQRATAESRASPGAEAGVGPTSGTRVDRQVGSYGSESGD